MVRHHRGRHGFGNRFGGFPGSGFREDDNVPPGRKLGAAELQIVLLALLAAQPAHGYELIRMLEERSSGFYTPSPGMIYPALTYLEEVGHTAVTQEGNRKLYAITKDGEAHLAAHREQATAILEALARIGGRMAKVREAYAGREEGAPQGTDQFQQARLALKKALWSQRDCTAEEALRIARILTRATEEILKPD